MKIFTLLRRHFVFLTFIICALVLTLCLRGIVAHPTSHDLLNSNWTDKGPFELSPERGRYSLIYSIVEDHTPFFSLDLARFTTPDLGYKNGKYVSLFAPGVSYIAAAGYIIGSWFGATQLGAFATIAFFALCNSMLIYALARKLNFARLPSLLSSLIFLFATPAFSYGVNLYQHHISTFLILAALYLVFFTSGALSLSLVWMLCAMSVPIDYPNVFLMLPIGIYGLTKLVSLKSGRSLTLDLKLGLATTLLTMILPLGLFLWFNNASYGNPLQLSGTVSSVAQIGDDGYPTKPVVDFELLGESYIPPSEQHKSALRFFEARDLVNGLYTHLFARDRGVIYFTPVILLGLLGSIWLYRKHPQFTIVISSVALATLLLYSLWGDPWGGWAFGSRYLIPAYAMLSLMIAAYLDHYRRAPLALLLFLVLSFYSIYVNTAGALGTTAIPPKVQVLHLESISGVVERYSWDRSVAYLQGGRIKSFFYNRYLSPKLTPIMYFYLITSGISIMIATFTVILYFAKAQRSK